jgi:transcriptional regulator with XRE-family HTH domain
MARRGIPNQINWYLREWMEATEAYRGRGGQARMMKATGWSKATMSQLYNNKQDYSPEILNAAALALNVEPFELLMKPERAYAYRRQREAAVVLAHDAGANKENNAAQR